VSETRITRVLEAPRERVYAALVDPDAFPRWKAPSGMSCRVDSSDGRGFRVSLTYDDADRSGKTTEHTDTYRGSFVELVPNERIVEIDEFETDDPALQGAMTITYTLDDADGRRTELTAVHAGLPRGVAPADNELGWAEALDRLAELLGA
jgi:uncharacterized protein YndB with AHSA1/START domain